MFIADIIFQQFPRFQNSILITLHSALIFIVMAQSLIDAEETHTNTFSFSQTIGKNKIVQLSVKSPQFYKDSVARDVIQCYCPIESQKVLIVCTSSQQAQNLYNSEYLKSISVLIHNGLDRRQRIKNARDFEENYSSKILITNNITSTHVKNPKVKLIVFISPPQNCWIYNQAVDLVEGLEFVIICYSTKQIKAVCDLEARLLKKFIMLTPPDVESEEQPPQNSGIQQHKNIQNKSLVKYHKFQVVVKNIHPENNWIDLKKFMAENGVETTDVRVILMKKPFKEDERKKKAGFVSCRDKNNFEKALRLDGTQLNGRKLNIILSKQRS